MPTYVVNRTGVDKARSLIEARQYVLDSSWSDKAPGAAEENADLDRHGWDQYTEWHLAIDTEAAEETKDRYGFPFGDFRRVHRSALIAAKARAAQNGHDAIAVAAHELLEHLDQLAAV